VLYSGSTRDGYAGKDLSKMMAKYEYRTCYMKIDAILVSTVLDRLWNI